MKKITRLLLINWHYFSKELVDFSDINFLTGKNKAGKSTIIDALQVVLMGETRGSSFNRAANKKSDRSLKSYLIGAMGSDIDAGKKSLRGGRDFTSYIVAEIFDDVKGAHFSLGAVFDSFSDGSDARKRFFWLKSGLPDDMFIVDNRPMDTRELKGFFEKNYKNKYETKDANDAYQRLLLGKLNVHDPRMFPMMKKAISFEPINNIEKFITENVCDAEEDINIADMQQNIAYYKKQEQLAESFSEKLNSLEVICSLYEELEAFRNTRKIQSYLISRSEQQNTLDLLEQDRQKAVQYDADIVEFEKQYGRLETRIQEMEEVREQLKSDIMKYRIDQNVDTLQAEMKELTKQIEDIAKNVARFLQDVRLNGARWSHWFSAAAPALEQLKTDGFGNAVTTLTAGLKRLAELSEEDFFNLSSRYFFQVREAFFTVRGELSPMAVSAKAKWEEWNGVAQELTQQIQQLERGIKSYPPAALRLKKAVEDGLCKRHQKPTEVAFLADLIDISDDRWRNAAEGYLNTQRMYLVVAPEFFMDAYSIYKQIRREMGHCEYRIIDCQKVYQAKRNLVPDSLAQVVDSDNKYAKAYVEYILGGVTRCFDDSKIRDNRTSVTESCMLYKGFSVGPINPQIYQTPYIGQKSIARQIELKKEQLEEAQKELHRCRVFYEAASPIVEEEWFLTDSFVQTSVQQNHNALQQREELVIKLADKRQRYDAIDLMWLGNMENKERAMGAELEEQRREKEETFGFIQSFREEKDKTVMQIIPQREAQCRAQTEALKLNFEDSYAQEVGEPRFFQELQRLGTAREVCQRFELFIKNTRTSIERKETEVRNARSEYNRIQNISFDANDVETNAQYRDEYEKIRDYELPAYRKRIEKAKQDAMEQFKSDFLYRLKNNIETATEKIRELNSALKSMRFENDTYRFEIKPNTGMLEYYNMIMSSELQSGEMDLFGYEFTQKYGSTIENLFGQIVDISGDTLEGRSTKAAENIEMFSQYKTYLTFDLLVRDANGITRRFSESSGTNSGGEGQTPFYVAMLASFAQLYKINDYSEYGNTFRLVIFDEAFNKMDHERISESIKLLRELNLQAIVCAPPDKVGDMTPLADKTWLVYKEERDGRCKSRVIEWTKDMNEYDE